MDTADDFLSELQTGLPPEAGATVAEVVQPAQAVAVADEQAVEPEKRKVGRPKGSGLLYTLELADEIVERLSDGTFLRVICRDDHMPNWRTVYDWMEDFPEFGARVARARGIGYDAIAEDTIVDIADYGKNDVITLPDGRTIVDTDVIQRSKLRVDTRLKMLATWSPKYRAKQDPAPPTQVHLHIEQRLQQYQQRVAELPASEDGHKPITIESTPIHKRLANLTGT